MKQMGRAMYERYKSQEESAYTIENLQKMMIPTLREEFAGIRSSARTLEEAFEWMIKVIHAKTIDKYNGLDDIILFPFYKLFCNPKTITAKEKRMYLKGIATGFESYLKKLYYLINGKEVTDKNGDVEHAALGNAIYCMKLNQLQYSQQASDKKFAQYLELLKDFRNDESHSGKVFTPQEISLGVHIVTTMFVYVTFVNITELEMAEDDNAYPAREEETGYSMAAEGRQ
jgi:type I restriction enzyme R subunit